MKAITLHKTLALFFAATLMVACEDDAYEFEPKGEALTTAGLVSPANGSSLVLNSGTPEETVTISWNAARSGLGSTPTYTFIAAERTAGSLENPEIEIQANNEGKATSLTLTQQQLDAALAEAGYAAGEMAELMWSIRSSIPTNTSIANPYEIDIQRFGVGIGSINLLSPQSWSELTLSSARANETITINWEAAEVVNGDEVTYEWQAVTRGESFDEPLIVLPSDDYGTANQLTVTQQQLDDLLAEKGYDDSEKADLEWRIKATADGFVSYSAKSFKLSVTRMGGILYRVYLSQPVPEGYNVYVAGALGYFTGTDWQEPGSNPALMLEKESDLVYTITLPFPAEDRTIAHKFAIAPVGGSSWSHGEQHVDPATGNCNNADNRSLQYTEGLEAAYALIGKWENMNALECPEYITFTVTVPETTPADKDVYLAGNFDQVRPELGPWNQPGTDPVLKMNKVGDFTYSLTIPVATVSGNTFPYKYFLATAAAPNWGNGEQKFNAANDGCEGRDNRSATFDQSKVINDVVTVWEGYCPY
ncbi:SusE domain-containing protein [Cesiribacter sp. SM1]|uniref:SusE domain-containing protein n=1 Tax=Cesiribacter sp. SM1 TaxID=2861196 RepID=UPI001CD687FC|nr:SusE domain-containing protein [Cesiribacter sp. SM1]